MAVTSPAAATEVFDKTVAQIQENIAIEGSKITGTSKYVGPWTTVFPDTEGDNYLAIKAEAATGSTVYVGVQPYQTSEWYQLDADGLIVLQLTDETEKVRVKAVKGASENIAEYSLSDLVLESE